MVNATLDNAMMIEYNIILAQIIEDVAITNDQSLKEHELYWQQKTADMVSRFEAENLAITSQLQEIDDAIQAWN